MVNLIQSTLCAFIVEDTRSVFKERAAAAQHSNSNNTTSNQGSGSGGARRNTAIEGPVVVSNRYDDRDEEVVSYVDAIAAAKTARRSRDSQKPWSLTMRPSGGGGDGDMNSSVQACHSLAPWFSHLHYWERIGTLVQTWRGVEDEIPMTRTRLCRTEAVTIDCMMEGKKKLDYKKRVWFLGHHGSTNRNNNF